MSNSNAPTPRLSQRYRHAIVSPGLHGLVSGCNPRGCCPSTHAAPDAILARARPQVPQVRGRDTYRRIEISSLYLIFLRHVFCYSLPFTHWWCPFQHRLCTVGAFCLSLRSPRPCRALPHGTPSDTYYGVNWNFYFRRRTVRPQIVSYVWPIY